MRIIITLFILLLYFNLTKIKKVTLKIPTDFYPKNLYQKESFFIQKEYNWYISIPKINLNNIPIKDGISDDILENYVGHFPNSSFLKGNVCLAAHNNGFSNNYFSNINMLDVNDKIYYYYFNIEKIYTVKSINIIDENNFSALDIDNNDKLTLITCVSNSPHQRLCVEAICEE